MNKQNTNGMTFLILSQTQLTKMYNNVPNFPTPINVRLGSWVIVGKMCKCNPFEQNIFFGLTSG